VISLKNITKSFKLGDNEIEILHGINLEIKKGEFIAIIGQSGSGKSTLMNILGCLDSPSGGQYLLDGKDISKFDSDALAKLRRDKFGSNSAQICLNLTRADGCVFDADGKFAVSNLIKFAACQTRAAKQIYASSSL